MNKKEMTDFLVSKNACSDGLEWGRDKSLEEIWNTCERADWMMWLYKYLSPKKKKALKVAIYSAELVLPIFEKQYPNDKRPREAIESAKRVLKNDTKKNRDLASASSASAYSASSAYYVLASASASAYSASSVAYAKKEINDKICKLIRKLIKVSELEVTK